MSILTIGLIVAFFLFLIFFFVLQFISIHTIIITFLKSEYKPTIFLILLLAVYQFTALSDLIRYTYFESLNVSQISSELEYVFIFFLSVFLNTKDP